MAFFRWRVGQRCGLARAQVQCRLARNATLVKADNFSCVKGCKIRRAQKLALSLSCLIRLLEAACQSLVFGAGAGPLAALLGLTAVAFSSAYFGCLKQSAICLSEPSCCFAGADCSVVFFRSFQLLEAVCHLLVFAAWASPLAALLGLTAVDFSSACFGCLKQSAIRWS